MIYTVTLNPAIDCIMQLDELHTGKTNRAAGDACQAGGKGINVSVMLRNLGIESTLLGLLAGFTGEEIRRLLTEQGCSCEFITVASGHSRINVKIKGETETEINGIGPTITQADAGKLMEQILALKSGDTLVLAGSIPSGISQNIYEEMMQQLSGRQVQIAVDAEDARLRRTLPYHPFLIKPNHHELGTLFEREIVSMAEKGAVLCTERGRILHQPSAKGRVVNSVGAGDSMVAGFLAGWQKTQDYAEALRLGTAAGAASAFSSGIAQYAAIEAILRTLPEIEEI